MLFFCFQHAHKHNTHSLKPLPPPNTTTTTQKLSSALLQPYYSTRTVGAQPNQRFIASVLLPSNAGLSAPATSPDCTTKTAARRVSPLSYLSFRAR